MEIGRLGPGSYLSVLFVGTGKWVGVVRASGKDNLLLSAPMGMDNMLLSAPFQDGYGQYASFGFPFRMGMCRLDLVAT
jgi:hypothetical protein